MSCTIADVAVTPLGALLRNERIYVAPTMRPVFLRIAGVLRDAVDAILKESA